MQFDCNDTEGSSYGINLCNALIGVIEKITCCFK